MHKSRYLGKTRHLHMKPSKSSFESMPHHKVAAMPFQADQIIHNSVNWSPMRLVYICLRCAPLSTTFPTTTTTPLQEDEHCRRAECSGTFLSSIIGFYLTRNAQVADSFVGRWFRLEGSGHPKERIDSRFMVSCISLGSNSHVIFIPHYRQRFELA